MKLLFAVIFIFLLFISISQACFPAPSKVTVDCTPTNKLLSINDSIKVNENISIQKIDKKYIVKFNQVMNGFYFDGEKFIIESREIDQNSLIEHYLLMDEFCMENLTNSTGLINNWQGNLTLIPLFSPPVEILINTEDNWKVIEEQNSNSYNCEYHNVSSNEQWIIKKQAIRDYCYPENGVCSTIYNIHPINYLKHNIANPTKEGIIYSLGILASLSFLIAIGYFILRKKKKRHFLRPGLLNIIISGIIMLVQYYMLLLLRFANSTIWIVLLISLLINYFILSVIRLAREEKKFKSNFLGNSYNFLIGILIMIGGTIGLWGFFGFVLSFLGASTYFAIKAINYYLVNVKNK